MVKIRLKRLGRKKRPFYRIVVMDIRTRRQGAPLAELGYYNPLSRELKLDKQAADSWVSKGAIPSDAVGRLLKQAPETGELIILEKAKKERISKKEAERRKAEAEQAAAQQAAVEEAPVAVEEPAAETPAEEAPAAEEQAETAEA